MAKILVVGGAGFVGSYCCRRLLSGLEDTVIAFDAFLNYDNRLKSDYDSRLSLRFGDIKDKVNVITGDVRYVQEVTRALQETKPDTMIYLAAIPDARLSEKFPEAAMDINAKGAANCLEAIKKVPSAKRFVFASSSYVYGNFKYSPADELHPTSPIDVYGRTKLEGEAITKSLSEKLGIEWVIVRPSAIYGPGDTYSRVSRIFVENALSGKPLKLFNGGMMQLDFTYVSDAANAIVLAAKKKKAANEVINITRGQARTVKEFAETVAKNVPGTRIEAQEANEKIPSRGELDSRKAKKLLGFEPKHSIEQGIPKYLKGVREKRAIE